MLVDARGHPNDDHEGSPVPAEEGCRRLFAMMEEDVAVDHPSVDDVTSHPGYRWLHDTAEVLDKNDNVYADIFSLVLAKEDAPFAEWPLEQVREAIAYIGDTASPLADGSPWALCATLPYVDFLADLTPGHEAREALAWRTATEAFDIPLDAAG